MSELIWEDPPRQTHHAADGGLRHDLVAAGLRERPGEWARVFTLEREGQARQYAHYIRRGGLAAFRPDGFFEAVSRTTEGECRVYARYVGGKTGE